MHTTPLPDTNQKLRVALCPIILLTSLSVRLKNNSPTNHKTLDIPHNPINKKTPQKNRFPQKITKKPHEYASNDIILKKSHTDQKVMSSQTKPPHKIPKHNKPITNISIRLHKRLMLSKDPQKQPYIQYTHVISKKNTIFISQNISTSIHPSVHAPTY